MLVDTTVQTHHVRLGLPPCLLEYSIAKNSPQAL